MNKPSLLYALLLPVIVSTSSHAGLIAFWDFNDGFSEDDETSQIVHNASQGLGTLFQQRADTDGNGKGGIIYVDTDNNINTTAGRAMAWDDIGKSGDNDAEFFMVIDTSGFKDITLRFDIQGNDVVGSGVNSFDLKYSLNPLVDVTNPDVSGTIKDFAESTSIANNTAIGNPLTYTEVTVDLSSVTAINDQGLVVLRLDDWDGNDDMRIDNFSITGTAVPEPHSATLAMIGSMALLLRRRR